MIGNSENVDVAEINGENFTVERLNMPVLMSLRHELRQRKYFRYYYEFSLAEMHENGVKGSGRRDVYNHRDVCKDITFICSEEFKQIWYKKGVKAALVRAALIASMALICIAIVSPPLYAITTLIFFSLPQPALISVLLCLVATLINAAIMLGVASAIRELTENAEKGNFDDKFKFDMDGNLLKHPPLHHSKKADICYNYLVNEVQNSENKFGAFTKKQGILKNLRYSIVQCERRPGLFALYVMGLPVQIALLVASGITYASRISSIGAVASANGVVAATLVMSLISVSISIGFAVVLQEYLKVWKPSVQNEQIGEFEFYIPEGRAEVREDFGNHSEEYLHHSRYARGLEFHSQGNDRYSTSSLCEDRDHGLACVSTETFTSQHQRA